MKLLGGRGAQFSVHLICTPFPTATLKLHCMMFPVVQKESSAYLETINHTFKFINHKIPSDILHETWPSMANFSSLVLYLNNTVMLEGRLRIPARSLFWTCLKAKCSKAKISLRDRRKNSFTEGERQNSEASFNWSDRVCELKWIQGEKTQERCLWLHSRGPKIVPRASFRSEEQRKASY